MTDRTFPLNYADQNALWDAFHDRDRAPIGQLYMAVRTTGIYCRPGCPARSPKRENVRFFATQTAAERAGFRACKRCKPRDTMCDPRLVVVEDACRWIEDNVEEDVSLAALSAALCVGPQTIQRAFRDVLGLTPRAYSRERRLERFRDELRGGSDVAQALYGAGFSSPSRVYESAERDLGMTPARYKSGADQIPIQMSIAETPFGYIGVGRTERGICAVRLGDSAAVVAGSIRGEFPQACLTQVEQDPDLDRIVDHVVQGTAITGLALDVRGTVFQHKVWDELRRIPRGQSRTYTEIARTIGEPKATRAVANACGANPVALAVPCHRVVRADGATGGYRWGAERKAAILEMEKH